MDEWEIAVEEAGGFGRLADHTTVPADMGWKDELNLAEFPITALTDRIPAGRTTLVFEDRLERGTASRLSVGSPSWVRTSTGFRRAWMMRSL
jgi:hypothetical protein